MSSYDCVGVTLKFDTFHFLSKVDCLVYGLDWFECSFK